MDVSLPQSTLPHRPSSTKTVSSQPDPAMTLTKSEQLWSEAYRIVKERELALVQSYERNLSPNNTTFTSPSQIQDAVKRSLDNREAHKIIITIAGKSIKIREYGEKLVKFTMWSKDLISSAVSTEPHAALAWVGISLLLPVSLLRASLCPLNDRRSRTYRWRFDRPKRVMRCYRALMQYRI
jgi:N-terminal domain of NWD NACHT-NTPase